MVQAINHLLLRPSRRPHDFYIPLTVDLVTERTRTSLERITRCSIQRRSRRSGKHPPKPTFSDLNICKLPSPAAAASSKTPTDVNIPSDPIVDTTLGDVETPSHPTWKKCWRGMI